MQNTSRKFQFLKAIASGGFGDVYLCKEFHSSGFSRLVAVKILRSKWTENEEIVSRMRDEAKLLGLLRHRNIIKVHELTSLEGRTALVMEYLEALDLSNIIDQMRNMRRRLPPRVSLEIVAAVAVALDAAYNQPPFPGEKPLRVIHRDIKPSNIMIDSSGVVKVLDFGVARAEFDTRESSTRELQFGSLEYMAPERLFFEPETPASDIYSLSASLFECLAAQKFGKASPRFENHAERLEAQVKRLIPRLKIGAEAKQELTQLLRSGLSFEGNYRLSAVEFAQRARMLARAIPGIDLVNWAEKAIPYISSKLQQEVKPEGTLLHKIIEEDSVVLRAPIPTSPVVPTHEDQDSLSRGALAELTLVDPTEHHNEHESRTKKHHIISFDSDNTVVTKESEQYAPPNATIDFDTTVDNIPIKTDEIVLNPFSGENTEQTPASDKTLELSIPSERGGLAPIEMTSGTTSRTEIQELRPNPTAMRSPDKPFSFEKNEPSTDAGVQHSFPWKTLIFLCFTLFVGLVTGGYFLIGWLSDGLETPIKPKVVENVVVEKPLVEKEILIPDNALVFKSTLPDTKLIEAHCDGLERYKAEGNTVFIESESPAECRIIIRLEGRNRHTLVVSDIRIGHYECDSNSCILPQP